MRKLWGIFIVGALALCAAAQAQLLGTTFTYQGSLREGGVPASGSYDFEFNLYAAASNGSALTAPLAKNAVVVDNGVFTVPLDFGDQFTGAARFLEVKVKHAGAATFTVLAPRQSLTPAPYALHAEFVADGTIVSASIQTNAVTTVKIADAAVTTGKIADGAVTYNQIADGAVGNAKIGDGAVGRSKVNPYEVQLRIAARCPHGAPMIGVMMDGAPLCDFPVRTVASGTGYERVSVAVRADDRPLVAYRGPMLYDCADANCTSGTARSIAGAPPGSDVTMALRSDGRPVLAYAAGSSTGPQTVVICGDATCSSGNVVRTVDSSSTQFGVFSVLALNADKPVVAYFDYANSYRVMLYACSDSTCASGVVRTLIAAPSGYTPAALRVRPNGSPVVALRNYTASTAALYDCNDATCSSGTLRAQANGAISRFAPGLAVRSDNRPLMSNNGSANAISLYDCADAACSSSTPRTHDAGSERAYQSAVAIRSDGRPLVAYGTNANAIKLLDCTGSDCSGANVRVIDVMDGYPSDREIAMALRADSRPVIAYPNGSNGVRLLLCPTDACK